MGASHFLYVHPRFLSSIPFLSSSSAPVGCEERKQGQMNQNKSYLFIGIFLISVKVWLFKKEKKQDALFKYVRYFIQNAKVKHTLK